MNSARAAINAALEAARAASGQRVAPKRPGADAAPPQPAPAAAPAAPAPGADPGRPINVGPAGMAPGAPAARMAPPAAPSGPSASMAPPAAAPASRPGASSPPWDRPQAQAQSQAQAEARQPQARAAYQDAEADGPPSWVTEFSDDTAVAAEASAVLAPAPAVPAVRAPAAPPHAYVITPVPAIDWDGNWPALAAGLALRGVSQQLALQTELVKCHADAGSATFHLRVPVDTLRASGNSEKLQAALQERFPSVRVNLETELGPTWYTASAEAKAAREERQRQAEAIVAGDAFVQDMERTFNAFVVPGSVKPPVA